MRERAQNEHLQSHRIVSVPLLMQRAAASPEQREGSAVRHIIFATFTTFSVTLAAQIPSHSFVVRIRGFATYAYLGTI